MRFYARLRIFMLCYAVEELAVCGGVKKSCRKGRIRPSETDFRGLFFVGFRLDSIWLEAENLQPEPVVNVQKGLL